MKLTNTQCKNAKPTEKPYKLSDGKGLHLLIMPNGSKYWRLKYRFLGKEKQLSIGVYPEIRLKEAREKTDIARKKISDGIDPSFEKKTNKQQAIQQADNTFKSIALEWHKNNLDVWSLGYSHKIIRCLEKHLFPDLGNCLLYTSPSPRDRG